jgi:glycopeptide antibiotics resistance protein
MARRLVLFVLAGASVAFVAYGSLVPFNLAWVPFDEAVARFTAAASRPVGVPSGSDAVSNIALAVPAAFFLTGAIADRSRRRAMLAVPIVAVAGFGVAVAVEFSQIYSPGRTASWLDVWAQLVGAAFGGLLWVVVGPFCSRWLTRLTLFDSPRHTAVTLLGLYVVGWIVLGAVPFDFSIRPAELYRKWRSGRVVPVPFSGTGLDLWLDFGGTLLRAVPVGAFAALAPEHLRSAPRLTAVVWGTAAVATLEMLQLLVLSRTADTTDLLAGFIGVAVGVAMAHRWRASSERGAPVSRPAFRTWALGALLLWVGVLVARHWAPFEFTSDPQFVRSRILRTLSQVPFESYYWSTPLFALAEALTKILLAVPVGVLLDTAWPAPSGRLLRLSRSVALVLAGSLLFAGIEFGQILLPARVPDVTDVLLGGVGVILGLAASFLFHTAAGRHHASPGPPRFGPPRSAGQDRRAGR